MRIKQLDIYGYGKWVDQTFHLEPGLQVFLGDNEAGKSTMTSFIHSILFGFPTRNSTLLRYEPLASSKYGGRLLADDARFGEVIIERVHGKVTGDVTVTLEDGTVGSDALLDTLLKGVTRETFQNIFSFSLTDIENVQKLNKNELSRYLLNIGAHATDYYLNMVDDFQKNAYNLYRPSGRIPELNKQLSEIKNQEQQLLELEKKNDGYLDLIEKNNAQNEALLALERKQEAAKAQLTNIKELKKEFHLYEEIRELTAEIKEYTLPPLKKDGNSLLEEYKKEISKTNDQLQENNLASQAQKDTFAHPDIIDNYEKYKEEIIALEQNLPEIIEQLSELQRSEASLKSNSERISVLETSLAIERQIAIPTKFSAQEATEVKEWTEELTACEVEQAQLQSEMQNLENQIQLKNQKADQYEEMMWETQTLKQVEEQLQAPKRATSQEAAAPASKAGNERTATKIRLLMRIISAFLLGGAFFATGVWQIITAALGAIVLVLSFLLFKAEPVTDTSSDIENKPTAGILQSEYEKQLTLKKAYETLLGEIDAVQAVYQEKRQKVERSSKQKGNILARWQLLLLAHHLPENLAITQAEEIMEITAELTRLQEERNQLTKTLLSLKTKLEQVIEPISAILAINATTTTTEKIHLFRQYLKELNAELAKEETKLNELNVLQHKKDQLLAHKKGTQNKINHLLEATGVETEDDFLTLYEQKEQRDAKQSRLDFLKENVSNFNSEERLLTKEDISQKEAHISKKLAGLNEAHKEAVMELTSTQLTIQNLEKDGTYTEALQAFENQKAVVQHLVDEWISDKLAAGIIQNTLNQVTKERFEEIIFEVNAYFHLLTDGEYEKIVFNDEELFVQQQDGKVVDVKVLSRGTAEPLYVAIRLAFIINMQDMIKLPLIMDDPFVNFDQKRKENMYRLIEELSDQVQILYFTFDRDVSNHFDDHQLLKLNEIKT